MTNTDTLADALPREIARVTAKKERWQGYCRDHPELAWGMQIGINVMALEIEGAIKAAASGDVLEMLQAHATLKEYSDDD